MSQRGRLLEVLRVFLRLGLTSFGGPIAHLGYFRAELVERRRWIADEAFADLLALCQFLPGPASSQMVFALGLGRAGLLGGLVAFTAFALPSAVALFLFALGAGALSGPLSSGALHGLKLVAVAIVAQAVSGMAKALCPDRQRATVAGLAALLVLGGFSSLRQLAAIALGGLAGLIFCRASGPRPAQPPLAPLISKELGALCLAVFALLLLALPALLRLWPAPRLELFDAFYRSGALVFGGGHVVLPLLRGAVVARGWVGDDAFLAGYGAAQAVPGPLFTFAAYLGAVARPAPGIAGAAIALLGIFLPGLLVLTGALPYWDRLRSKEAAQAALRGINAAVVGLLAAALYDPVFSTAVRGRADFALALGCFVLLTAWRAPPLAVVIAGALAGVGLALSGQ